MPVMDGLTLLAELRARQSPARARSSSGRRHGEYPYRNEPRRVRFVTNRSISDLEITIKKTLDDIGRVREIDRQRAVAERARANLSRYFSPNLVDMLADRDEPLGPVRRETVAVLFVDIVGFTRMAENMLPEAVVTMLRQFHDRMTAEIFACGGTVEKYIGDAIFAVFGLPSAGPNDAANALRCADGMLTALASWNSERGQAGEPPVGIGIGLNTARRWWAMSAASTACRSP